jgi:ribosomal-protein-alanine N-acetyltransferase
MSNLSGGLLFHEIPKTGNTHIPNETGLKMKFVTPTLTTTRLILRPVTLKDAPAIQAGFASWAVIQNMSPRVPWPYPDDGAEQWINEHVLPPYEDGSMAIWGITKTEEPDTVIGVITIRDDTGAGHRGFWLAEKHWGQGYMTEAVAAVTKWVFRETHLEELVAYNSALNTGSRRVKIKTGSEFVQSVELLHHNGETASEVWRLTKENWLSHQTSDKSQ